MDNNNINNDFEEFSPGAFLYSVDWPIKNNQKGQNFKSNLERIFYNITFFKYL